MEFDHEAIDDAGLRTEFMHLALRARNVGRSLHQAYGTNRLPFAFRYINGFEFNAYASADESAYRIELNASVPLFSILLFSRLLSDPQMLPFLDGGGQKASAFYVPFVLDPADFRRRVDWNIELTAIRSFAAGTIADLCSTFVLCHEFGHVLGGHIEGLQHYYRDTRLAELVAVDPMVSADTTRRQAWEYEADLIAALLVVQFVDELVSDREVQPRTREVFSDEHGFHFEHTLAIAVVSLFCFFVYVQGMRLKLNKHSSHPHPHVRATYMKHALLRAAHARRPVNNEVFHRLLDIRLGEAMNSLELAGLFEPRRYTRRFMQQVDVELKRMNTLYSTHRDSCSAWRWIE